jgi:RNA polymerase sigma-70 factor, ECF subfamily
VAFSRELLLRGRFPLQRGPALAAEVRFSLGVQDQIRLQCPKRRSRMLGNFFIWGREMLEKTECDRGPGKDVGPGEIDISEQTRDDVLLGRAAKGDEEAFTVLYRRHQAAIYRFALRMTGNPWASEEIVQDVFMTLMREPKKYDAERAVLAAYLYGITRNRVMKHLERLPPEVALDEHNKNGSRGGAAVINAVTPMHWAEGQERIQQVRAAVLELPAEFREAVVLCELEELSYEEASQRMGCPVGTIRSRLHRGRALLLAKLEMLRDVPRRFSAAR